MNSQDVILGMLMNRSLSGYDIKNLFETLFSYFFDASYGTIYPTLGKMEKEGLITKASIQQEGKPNKNVYTITDHGREIFSAYLASPLQGDLLKSDLLVRLQFSDCAEPDKVIAWMEQAIVHSETAKAQLLGKYEEWKEHMSVVDEISFQFGIAGMELKSKLMREGIEKIRKTKQLNI